MKRRLSHLFVLPVVFGLLLSSCNNSVVGPQGPKGDQGVPGLVGPQGEKGADGVNGTDGSSVLTGRGAPQNSLGKNGDSYINLDSWDYYVKTNNVWILQGNIKGADGQNGTNGTNGTNGSNGVSIVSIRKTSSEGNVDTYTITYSDNTTSTFTVTNGVDGQSIQGEPGENGHTPEITIGNNGNWFVDGQDTGMKAQGPKGQDGRSIIAVSKSSSDGDVDTYTITYSDGTSTTYQVTNGHTPVISIGDNGNWYIDGTDTGVRALGIEGAQGQTGPEGPQGPAGISITSVNLTSSSNGVDTYTITYSNNTTSTFTVTNGHTPVITIGENGNWFVDGVDTGVSAKGQKGDPGNDGQNGKTPYIGLDGYWYIDGESTGVKATGDDGLTPYVGQNGNWFIGDQDTGIKATGTNGTNGADGKDGKSITAAQGEPDNEEGNVGDSYIDIETWNYYLKEESGWVNKGSIKGADGQDGTNGTNGVSIVSIILTGTNENVDTYTIYLSNGESTTFTVTNGTQGIAGNDGTSPHIGENGNWWIGETDTGVKAQGPQGNPGTNGTNGTNGTDGVSIVSIELVNSEDGVDTYVITFSNTDTYTYYVRNGVNGKSAYELYCEAHPDYEGSEEEWLDDLVNDRLSTKNTYTVTFHSNGGSEVESQQVVEGEHVIRPSNPTKANYGFGGWYTVDGEQWVFLGCVVLSDVDLYAKWNADSYTITYHLDGGINGFGNPDSYKYGDSITLADPSREYSQFGGWYSDPDFENPCNQITASNTGDLDFYAKFTYNNYTFHFVTNGGSSVADLTLPYGTALPSISTTRNGYTFDGWYSDSSLNTKYTLPSTMPAENRTLYAKWTQIQYKVTITGNGFFFDDDTTPMVYVSISGNSYDAKTSGSFTRLSGQSFFICTNTAMTKFYVNNQDVTPSNNSRYEVKPGLNKKTVSVALSASANTIRVTY